MENKLVTVADLLAFREELIKEIKYLLNGADTIIKGKRKLKGAEVRKILDISPGTLQNFRIRGLLNAKKVGRSYRYEVKEVNDLLERGTKQ